MVPVIQPVPEIPGVLVTMETITDYSVRFSLSGAGGGGASCGTINDGQITVIGIRALKRVLQQL